MPIELDSKEARQSLVSVITRDLDRFGPLLQAALRHDPEAPVAETMSLEILDGGETTTSTEEFALPQTVTSQDFTEIESSSVAAESEALNELEPTVLATENSSKVDQASHTAELTETNPSATSEVSSTEQLEELSQPEAVLESTVVQPVEEEIDMSDDEPVATLVREHTEVAPEVDAALAASVVEPIEDEFDMSDDEPVETTDVAQQSEVEIAIELVNAPELTSETKPAETTAGLEAPSWIAETPDPFEEEPAKRLLDIIESGEASQPWDSIELPEVEVTPLVPVATPKKGIAGIFAGLVETFMNLVRRYLPFPKKK